MLIKSHRCITQYTEPSPRSWPPSGPSPTASPGPSGHPPPSPQHAGPPPSPGHAPSPSPQPPQPAPSPHQVWCALGKIYVHSTFVIYAWLEHWRSIFNLSHVPSILCVCVYVCLLYHTKFIFLNTTQVHN